MNKHALLCTRVLMLPRKGPNVFIHSPSLFDEKEGKLLNEES